MRNRFPTLVLIGLAAAMLCPPPIQAQLPQHIEQCLPFPTYQEETRDMLGVTPAEKRKLRTAFVESVELLGATTLPNVLREQIVAFLLHREFDADSDWLPEVQEIYIRGLLQQHGYFNTWVTDGIIRPLGNEAGRSRVAVTVEVNEGLQYRLAGIRFASQDPEQPITFPPEELRRLIPIDDGDILNVERIRQGLENLKLLYGTHGYIDFVSEPNFETHDAQRKITLTIALVSGLQFRIGSVEFSTLDADTVKRLKWVPVPGEIFDNEAFMKFFQDNKAIIPCAQPEHVEILRDLKRGTVCMVFKLRSCHELWARFFRCLQMRLGTARDLTCNE